MPRKHAYSKDLSSEIFIKSIINNNIAGRGGIPFECLEVVLIEGISIDKFADIRKITFPASIFTSKKFVISLYPNYSLLTENQKKVVLLHELMHINPDNLEKMVKHDIEDFDGILRKFGIDWKTSKALPDIFDKDIQENLNLELKEG